MATLEPVHTSDVKTWWHKIHDGLIRVCEESDRDDYPYATAMEDLLHGRSALFIIKGDRGEYAGFVILTPCQYRHGMRYVVVSAFYSLLPDRSDWDEGLRVIRDFAHKCGADFIENRTMRNGFEKVFPKLLTGWKPIYTIWRMEV